MFLATACICALFIEVWMGRLLLVRNSKVCGKAACASKL